MNSNASYDVLYTLSHSDLKELSSLCFGSVSPDAPTRRALRQLVGEQTAGIVFGFLQSQVQTGWSMRHLGELCLAVSGAKPAESRKPFDLVLSGPDVEGSPTRDTQSVMHSLLAEAKHEVLLVGYVIHNAENLFRPLAAKMANDDNLRVWCCLDIQRPWNDQRPMSLLVDKFRDEFTTKHWPWSKFPDVFFDPRSLEIGGTTRSSLHAKCIVVDRQTSLVTSANFTEAAQQRNIEAGVLIRDETFASRIAKYFDGLTELGLLTPVQFT